MPLMTTDGQRVVLDGIGWDTYERMLDDIGSRHIKLTYDSGRLEIMSPSRRHERCRHLIGRLIEQLTLELGIEIEGGGSTTWRRENLEKGLESDECYWIQNESAVRDRDELDLRVDPPPDLAVEADVWSSSVSRMDIYAALGVPEVWRHDGAKLRVYVLAEGEYREAESSTCFPWLDMDEFAGWLDQREGRGETAWIREFAAWARRIDPSSSSP